MEQLNYMVCVSCMTYNHAPYITDALNGFCMQETTFPFVCTIVDDASTDGEQEVIKKYLQEHFDLEDKAIVRHEETDDYILTFVRHKTNKNCFFAVLYLKYNHYSIKKSKMPYVAEWRENCKYIALCEGDDYWIVADKLQRQVAFLEEQNDCYLCGSNGIVLWQGGIRHPRYFNNDFNPQWYRVTDLLGYWAFPTASLMIRRKVYDNYPMWTKKIYSGDLSVILICANKGEKVYSSGDITCVYRRDELTKSSISMTTSRIKVLEQHIMLYEEFNLYTKYQYASSINILLKYLKKDLKYERLKEKNKILPWFVMPIFRSKIIYRWIKCIQRPLNAFYINRYIKL